MRIGRVGDQGQHWRLAPAKVQIKTSPDEFCLFKDCHHYADPLVPLRDQRQEVRVYFVFYPRRAFAWVDRARESPGLYFAVDCWFGVF